jgi:uncharacterized protein (TIGR02246 family)
MVMHGSPAFENRHAEILATFYKGATKKHVVRKIRFVTPELAIVDIDNEVHGVTSMPGGVIVPKDGVIRTQGFVKRDGKWWIEAYHNVDVKAAARKDSRSNAKQMPNTRQAVVCHPGDLNPR